MLESFSLGLTEFLAFYQYQVLNLTETVMERRIQENLMVDEPLDSLKSRPVTLLELKIHLEPLIIQIQLMAFIAIKPYAAMEELDRKMLEQKEREINGDFDEENNQNIEIEKPSRRAKYWSKISEMLPSHQGNYLVINQLIPVFANEAWLEDFPTGANLLSYLYNILVSLESDLSVIEMVRKLFQTTLKPYLNFITLFIYEGEIEDPFNEFYIEKVSLKEDMEVDNGPKYLTSEIKRFRMKIGEGANLPIFLSRFGVQIFKCGSMLSLLQEIENTEYYSI